MLSGGNGAARERSPRDGRGRKKNQRHESGKRTWPPPVTEIQWPPPVIIRKEIPHSHALPLSLAPRRALSRPAPGRNLTCCSGIPGFGRGQGQGRGKYH